MKLRLLVIRQKGESQNGCSKKTLKHLKKLKQFPKAFGKHKFRGCLYEKRCGLKNETERFSSGLYMKTFSTGTG